MHARTAGRRLNHAPIRQRKTSAPNSAARHMERVTADLPDRQDGGKQAAGGRAAAMPLIVAPHSCRRSTAPG